MVLGTFSTEEKANEYIASESKKVKKKDSSPSESKANQKQKNELRLEAQPEPKKGESKTQTEVQGEKVNRFTGFPQDKANPKVQGPLKPNVTKTKLKTLLDNTPEFKANPVLTVEEIPWKNGQMKKAFAWNGETTQFTIYPEALGLVTEFLKVGDQVRISPETFKGTGQELRVKSYDNNGSGSSYASVGRYRDDTEVFLRNPDAIKPIQFPELVGLAKELTGNVPFLRKYQKANGMFYAKGEGEIGLNPELFQREIFASSSNTRSRNRPPHRLLTGPNSQARKPSRPSQYTQGIPQTILQSRQVPLALTLNCVSKCTSFQNTGVRTTKRLRKIHSLLTENLLRKFTLTLSLRCSMSLAQFLQLRRLHTTCSSSNSTTNRQ